MTQFFWQIHEKVLKHDDKMSLLSMMCFILNLSVFLNQNFSNNNLFTRWFSYLYLTWRFSKKLRLNDVTLLS